ncbi:MAG TPA: ABC transporter permease [Lachnospiraceae bacterium]|nr:ABC transporter permease [Lachnospiraceae bacterium]
MNVRLITSFGFAVLRLSTPLVFAALSAAICEKAGLFNMAAESMMLWGALIGVIVSGATHSALVGFLAAMGAGAVTGMLIWVATVKGKADLMLAQIAINLASSGGTIFLLFALTGEKSNSAVAIKSLALPKVNIPGISAIPVIGKILSGQNILTYGAIVAAIALNIFIFRSKTGHHIRAVGENPHAAESVGISVPKIYFLAWTISGVLGGIGGAFMSMGYLTSFTKDMVAGRGYIGLCASSMVGGSPIGAMFCALIFGVADAVSNQLQLTNAPADLVLMMPYIVTIVVLVFLSVIKFGRANRKAKARS